MEKSGEYKTAPIYSPIKLETENFLQKTLNELKVLSKKEELKEYKFQDETFPAIPLKQVKHSDKSSTVFKLWPNICIKSEPADTDDANFSISNKSDYEHKCRMEFDGIIKTEKIGEYTTSQCCNKTLKKMKLLDEMVAISPQWSNTYIKKEPVDIEAEEPTYPDNNEYNMASKDILCIKKEPSDTESEELNHPGDNVYNMTAKDIKITIKPDPTYQANLYIGDGTNHSPLEVGEDVPDNESNIVPNLSYFDKIIEPPIDINKINDDVFTGKRLDFSYMHNNSDIIEGVKKTISINEKENAHQVEHHNEYELISCVDKTIIPPNDINKINNTINIEKSSDISYTEKENYIIEESEKSDYNNAIEKPHQEQVKEQDPKEFEHLRTQLVKAMHQNPDTIHTMLCLARDQFRLGNNNAALRYNNLVLIIQPTNLCALLNKGSIFAKEGDLLRALEVFDKAMSEHPRSTQAKTYFCQTLKEMANRAKSISTLKDIKIEDEYLNSNENEDEYLNSKENEDEYLNSNENENVFIRPEYKEECKKHENNSPLRSESNVEDFITSQNEMLEELNTTLINTTHNSDTNYYAELTFKTQSEMLNELNTTLNYIDDNPETKNYEELIFNTKRSEENLNEAYLMSQNSIHEEIRLAIIGDTHALNYPLRLFSSQFNPYTFNFQPSIFSLHVNNTMDSILKECSKLDAAVIIIGGNDVACTRNTDQHIIQAFIQATSILLHHGILPIIVPIIPRHTKIPIPPEVFNNRALEINIKLRTALYRMVKFNPMIDYIYHKPELLQDGVNLTETEYQNLTKKIVYHYFKTNCRDRPG